ncbi:hypothetical protein CK203_081943 [Vitis vinifera]|uniref:Reverse transcriptase domain-containing protein n=1 Tax=Vitis vinifera TaxID=29760 RepID=A0A438DX58_VITVI|nr:hypothetical protein CK203_081943 [Vitis vinifera]
MTKKISDYRPISLITSLYKIITKVLAGRLRGILHETIHSTQEAFVQGRQILDAVLIVNEIVDEKKRSGDEGVVFKIDFEKAYDHVILVNGNAKGWVKASRGLRQGDPLSLFLFTIVADVLSRMFDVNLDKSNIYGINLGQNHLHRLAELLDCKASGWPILYLGLLLGGNPKSGGFWDPVIERISNRLDGWQKAYLSFGDERGIGFQKDFLMEFRSLREMVVEMVTSLSLEGYCTSLPRFFQVYLVHGRKWGKNSVLERLVVGGSTSGVRYPRLLRVVTDKNILIFSILGSTRPFSWNFNFRHNLFDSEIEDLESLMRSLDCLHLSPSVSDMRSCFPYQVSLEFSNPFQNQVLCMVSGSQEGKSKYGVVVIIVVVGYGYAWWKGWKLPDMMFATRRSLSDACSSIAKQLENVYSSIAYLIKVAIVYQQRLDNWMLGFHF